MERIENYDSKIPKMFKNVYFRKNYNLQKKGKQSDG